MDKNDDILMDGIDERIEAFLRGEMSAEEETAFKQEIRQNPELRSRAMAMTSLIKVLHDQNSAREANIIRENAPQGHFHIVADKEIPLTPKPRVRPILWWACSVAAVIAIFFSIYKDRRYSMLDATLSPYYSEYDAAEIIRGETDSVAITHLYSLFNQIPQKRNVSDIIKELESIYASLDTDYTYYPFVNDISWNLALAYIKNNQIDKAITILEKLMSDNPDTPIFVKADELLNKLKKM